MTDMSNKKRGSNFEREFASILSAHGFWVRLDKGYAQTCDIIAGKDNKIYLFECKTCSRDYFDLNRIEDNQDFSRLIFKKCGNEEAWMVYKAKDSIYLSQEPIKKPSEGVRLEGWLQQLEVK